MTPDEATQISKTRSYWLRHRPDAGGIVLDPHGWVEIDPVLAAPCQKLGRSVTRQEIEDVAAGSDKQRFRLEGNRIRANQGRSVAVDLAFVSVAPPVDLFHGTTRERWQRIQSSGGLAKMRRQQVHLSPDVETGVALQHAIVPRCRWRYAWTRGVCIKRGMNSSIPRTASP